jgi:hypothetical protein
VHTSGQIIQRTFHPSSFSECLFSIGRKDFGSKEWNGMEWKECNAMGTGHILTAPQAFPHKHTKDNHGLLGKDSCIQTDVALDE